MLLSMNEEERFRLTKEERLTGERRIETLFAKGDSFMAYPFRVVYLKTTYPQSVPLSVLVSIPKKRLKAAVDRNRMKRLFREAYRLNKHLMIASWLPLPEHIEVAFIYVKDELSDFVTVEKGVRKALRELTQQIRKEKC
jgi:ribonuclease P protein component